MTSSIGRRVLLSEPPFLRQAKLPEWNRRAEWPGRWISGDDEQLPIVAAYRLVVELEAPRTVLIHVSGDERYRLYLDGLEVGSGSERGDVSHWFFESYEIDLAAGVNTFVAQVWSLGPGSAFAQFSLGHGFIFCPDAPDLVPAMATGVAHWQVKRLSGYRFVNPQSAWGTGLNLLLEGESLDWGFERGDGEGWGAPVLGNVGLGPEGSNDKSPQRLLIPATLPPMVDALWQKARVRHVSFPAPGSTAPVPFRPDDNLAGETMEWTRLIIGHPLYVPAYSRRRVLLDLHDYVCAYPVLTVSAGRHSQIRVYWQEALFEEHGRPDKGNRDEIENKFFCTIYSWEEGVGDTFLPDGGDHRQFTTLWWQAGRYVELLIQTELQELVIESIEFREDRYPIENRLKFASSDPRLEEVGKLAFRTLQMCSHETYMDCPYYEQLQYIGDTRLQALVTYVTSEDDRLARKALLAFDWSRQVEGVTQSRYPSRVVQIIPPFSLWWVCMIWDFALWKGELPFVAGLMPGARMVLDWFLRYRNSLGLIEAPKGWNFVDWVPGWNSGMPPGADDGVSSILNRQFEIALRKMAELESWMGERELAARHLRHAEEIAAAVHRSFWNNKRGIYADDLAHSSYSEHAQVLSILTEALPEKIERLVSQGLLADQDLHRTTVYFAHYLFECFARLGRTDCIVDGMGLWTDHLGLGMKTIVEMPEPTRSDCHAWGAHPLYHYVASILGIRPKGLGSRELVIRPNLGGLEFANASFPFGGSLVFVGVRQTEQGPEFEVDLPVGISGTLVGDDRSFQA